MSSLLVSHLDSKGSWDLGDNLVKFVKTRQEEALVQMLIDDCFHKVSCLYLKTFTFWKKNPQTKLNWKQELIKIKTHEKYKTIITLLHTHPPKAPSQCPHSQVWSALDICWTDWPQRRGWVWGFRWRRHSGWQTVDSRACWPAAAWPPPASGRLSPEQHTDHMLRSETPYSCYHVLKILNCQSAYADACHVDVYAWLIFLRAFWRDLIQEVEIGPRVLENNTNKNSYIN